MYVSHMRNRGRALSNSSYLLGEYLFEVEQNKYPAILFG